MAEETKKQESVVNIANTTDDVNPSATLPDSEIKGAVIRICKDDDIKEVLYNAVERYKLQKEAQQKSERKERKRQERWYDKNMVKFLLYPLVIGTILTAITHAPRTANNGSTPQAPNTQQSPHQ